MWAKSILLRKNNSYICSPFLGRRERDGKLTS